MTTPPRALSAAEKLDWPRLIRSENVSLIAFHRLLAHFGSAVAALKALPDIARCGGRGRPINVCSRAATEREMDTPPLLCVRGHVLHILLQPAIAIVGARNASLNGCWLAWQIAAGPVGRRRSGRSPPLDPRAAGPNRLIRDGATLIERANDVLRELECM